jgi:hypothetical protein
VLQSFTKVTTVGDRGDLNSVARVCRLESELEVDCMLHVVAFVVVVVFASNKSVQEVVSL